MQEQAETVWMPLDYLQQNTSRIAFIQLNTPIDSNLETFKTLWKKAAITLFADGASNRVYHCTALRREDYIPDVINGDFDSVEEEVLQYYKSKGTEVIPTPDQDATDFTKGLKIVVERLQQQNTQVDYIVSHDYTGGRLDQIFSNLHTLFEAKKITNLPLYLVTQNSVSCLLHKGKHRIIVDSGLRGDWCGLIPLDGPCEHVTTTGLKWNLDKDKMRFTGLISTCNAFTGDEEVTVETDNFLLWTMGIKE